MSLSIHTLLADELDISEEKAQKLLSAMVREVKKRAHHQDKGAHLPELGQFTMGDGELTFAPSDSLARAVNHRFEGLEAEDLSNAPGKEEEDAETDNEGPSTITLGYQDGSNWSPIEEESGSTDSSSDDADADDSQAPDTDEFQAPDTDEFDAPDTGEFDAPDTGEFDAPDTGEFDAPDTGGFDAPDTVEQPVGSAPSTVDSPSADATGPPSPTDTDDANGGSSSDASSPESSASTTPEDTDPDSERPEASTQTTELYPLVEDVTGSASSEEESPASDSDVSSSLDDQEEHDELSGIWEEVEKETREMPEASFDEKEEPSSETEEEDDFSFPSVGDESGGADASTSSDASTSEASSSTESDAETSDSAAKSDEASSFDPDPAPPSPPKTPGADDSSTSPFRIIAAVLAFLLLGSGAWYILGERGVIQEPSVAFSTLSTKGESDGDGGEGESAAGDGEGSETTTSEPTADTEDASTGERPGDTAPSDPSESVSDANSDAPGSASDERSKPSDAASDDEASTSGETAGSSSPGISPADGGWSIIVASRSARSAAAELVSTYRDRLNEQVPVGIIQATVDNSTRYRVGIGQFSSRGDAQDFLNQYQSELPDGAWTVSLE